MNNLPAWIPRPLAWLNGLVLVILLRGIEVLLQLLSVIAGIVNAGLLPPPVLVLAVLGSYLLPIPIIAIAHHWIHVALDRFAPDSRTPDAGTVEGWLPGLMSWWEGLFGWTAIALALIVSNAVFSVVAGTSYRPMDWWQDELMRLFSPQSLLRWVFVAFLYQFEASVRQHLLAIGAATASDADSVDEGSATE